MSKIVENISELFSRDHRVPVSDADEMIVSGPPDLGHPHKSAGFLRVPRSRLKF
ncbi:hypothetical protein ACFY2W_02980 [Streptomyces sp. NPDC001262]|uniref:hypothetical protein n=1 Tax=Streptomyces sp. NPDC001262 TaxID=3364552 RepID=UPI0036848E53